MSDPEPQSPLTSDSEEETQCSYPDTVNKGSLGYSSPAPPPEETDIEETPKPPLSYGLSGDDGKTPG